MLDLGFIHALKRIVKLLPPKRQTLLFSATMPPPIKKLADRFLSNPKYIEVARPATANINIEQFKVKTSSRDKRDTLVKLLRTDDVTSALIFANRKTTVRELNKSLKRSGFSTGEIHGDMDQSSRIAELDRFKKGEINILVASDVAARGLDIKGVSHVFNYDTPWHPDDYIHRIGRTGRAGAKGKAFTMVTPEDTEAIANVEKLTGMAIPLFQLGEGGNVEPRSEPPKREPREREERPRRAKANSRGAEPPSREPEVADASEPEPPKRAPRAEPRKAEPARPEPELEDAGEDGEWNGPVPGFLGLSAL
jgi:superfamily II DNA/RNA helicase